MQLNKKHFGLIAALLVFTFGIPLVSGAIFLSFAIASLFDKRDSRFRLVNRSLVMTCTWFVWMFPAEFISMPDIVHRIYMICPVAFVVYRKLSGSTSTFVYQSFAFGTFAMVSFTALVRLLEKQAGALLTIIGYGYDNSHHYALFQFVMQHDQLPRYSSVPTNEINNLILNYPVGQTALWHIFLSPFQINGLTTNRLIALFALMVAISGLVLGACLITLVRKILQDKPSRREHLITAILLYSLIVLGSGGIILVCGFPPMLVALILISLIALMHDQEYSRSKSLLQISLTGILALTYSAVALPIVAAISIVRIPVFLRLFKAGQKKELAFLTIFGLGAILLAYAIFLPTARAWGWNQVLDLGGIQYFPVSLAVLTAAIAMWLLVLNFRSDNQNLFYPLVLVFVWISYLVFAIITHHYNHEITYYAHKQAYIATVLTIPGAIILVRRLWANSKYWLKIAAALVVLICFGAQIKETYSVVPVAINIASGYEFHRIDGDQILKILSETKSPLFVLVNTNTNTDLNSRWINGLNNTWTDAAWSIFLPPIETWPNYPEKLTLFTNLSPPPVLVTDDISNIPEQTRVLLTNAGWKILIEPRS
jgi:hypothetical protein